jgi:hypothetical protein
LEHRYYHSAPFDHLSLLYSTCHTVVSLIFFKHATSSCLSDFVLAEQLQKGKVAINISRILGKERMDMHLSTIGNVHFEMPVRQLNEDIKEAVQYADVRLRCQARNINMESAYTADGI